MRVVLLGPPGAGKGTQGEGLARRLGLPRLATGDILREAVRAETEIGREAQRHMDRGDLVPDEVVTRIVVEALRRPEAARGFVLDGFPRTIAQAQALEDELRSLGTELDAVVYFDVPERELVRRSTGRRICPSCGATYNVYSSPPKTAGVCDHCGGALVTRSDDDEATLRRRLRVYEQSTAPLVDRYRQSGVPFHRLDGLGSVDEIQARLGDVLGIGAA